MHHSEQKGLKTNALPGLLMSCCMKYTKETFLKKKATSTIIDPLIWKQFKDSRNKANNSMKNTKRKYFSENLDANKSDPHKTYH